MKALVLTENEQLKTTDVCIPTVETDEYLVRIVSAGVCSSDITRAFNRGAYHYPLIMGHELAGEIVGGGSKTNGWFNLEDRVVVFPLIPCFKCQACADEHFARCSSYDYYGSRRDGGFAQFISVKDWNLLPIPKNVSFEDAALCEPAAVVVHAISNLELNSTTSGQRIAVLGAGFLGLLAVQLLKKKFPTMTVVLADRNVFKLQLGKSFGAQTIHTTNADDWNKFTKQNRAGFSFVLEAAGTPESYINSIDLTKAGGKVVWMGNISDDLVISKSMVSSVLRKEITIRGTWNSNYRGDQPSDWTKVLQMMEEGWKPSRLVSHFVGLDGLGNLMTKLNEHKTRKVSHQILKGMMEVPSEPEISF